MLRRVLSRSWILHLLQGHNQNYIPVEVGLLFGVNNELQKLKHNVSAIKVVLLDAEDKQADNHQVRDWLQKLQDAAYYADDLVDEFYTEALQRRVMFWGRMTKKVLTFFSSSNQVAFVLKFDRTIKTVREALNEIKDGMDFYLMERLKETRVSPRARETRSFVFKEEVIGSNDENIYTDGNIISLIL
ncbi:hypothetical protein TIFTF001_017798 [Ficus carica]|uniref:Disease resistance N-terminal domain-containing protein n=1 Tax=Ficus carica TaxID=3494 RepID=A0AA88A8P1_FICCA|nr:hypothetical protein TIFTF001_017798 [Ficus carica]